MNMYMYFKMLQIYFEQTIDTPSLHCSYAMEVSRFLCSVPASWAVWLSRKFGSPSDSCDSTSSLICIIYININSQNKILRNISQLLHLKVLLVALWGTTALWQSQLESLCEKDSSSQKCEASSIQPSPRCLILKNMNISSLHKMGELAMDGYVGLGLLSIDWLCLSLRLLGWWNSQKISETRWLVDIPWQNPTKENWFIQ